MVTDTIFSISICVAHQLLRETRKDRSPPKLVKSLRAKHYEWVMKLGTGILFSLFLLIIVLAADLVLTKKQADNLHVQGTAALIDLSNQLDSAAFALNDLRRGGQMMTNDLAAASRNASVTADCGRISG